MHACMCIYMYAYACVHVCAYVCIHMYVYVCMRIYYYVYVHICVHYYYVCLVLVRLVGMRLVLVLCLFVVRTFGGRAFGICVQSSNKRGSHFKITRVIFKTFLKKELFLDTCVHIPKTSKSKKITFKNCQFNFFYCIKNENKSSIRVQGK